MNSIVWNPWHGCKKYSEGCKYCYVYRRDESVGRDASRITRTLNFDLPLKRNRQGNYKIAPGTTVFLCMTSDFFIEEADTWRPQIWEIIRQRKDLEFFIITKRILRFEACIPPDWKSGYLNVAVVCTMENQRRCDERFPVFNKLPIVSKFIACEPLLSDIDMSHYLNADIKQVLVGGESGNYARVCDYDWICHIRQQCIDASIRFYFKQTGANFKKGNKIYKIPRRLQHQQARKAGINSD